MLSTLYISLGLILNVFTKNDVEGKYRYNIYELSVNYDFNEIFITFTKNSFGIGLDTLYETLQYTSKFLEMEFDQSKPNISPITPSKEIV